MSVLSPGRHGGEEGPGTCLVHSLLTQEKRAFLRICSSTVTSLYRFFSPFNSLRSGLVVFGGTVEDRGAFMRALNNPSVVQ